MGRREEDGRGHDAFIAGNRGSFSPSFLFPENLRSIPGGVAVGSGARELDLRTTVEIHSSM